MKCIKCKKEIELKLKAELTDKETDAIMNRIIQSLETTFNAEIRK